MIRSFSSLISTTQERIKIARTLGNNHINNRRPSATFSSSISTTTTAVSPSVSPSPIYSPTDPLGNTSCTPSPEISSPAPAPQQPPISSLLQFRNHRKMQKMLRQVDKHHPNQTKKDSSNNTINTTNTFTSTSISTAQPSKHDHKSKHVSTDQRASGQEREGERSEQFGERTRARPSTSARASGNGERVEVAVESVTTATFQSFLLRLFLGNAVALLVAFVA